MFFKKATLFLCFGFKVKADLSWLFLSVLIYWMLATHTFPMMIPSKDVHVYQIMSLTTLTLLMVSIIAHEVAHAIVAEYYHMPIESITLFIFGGVAEMKGEPSHPKGEFLMALAGPAMSALLGGIFYAAYEIYLFFGEYDPVAEVLHFLGMLNLILAGFNMIPAFPLDGGRALRAAIWKYKGDFILATRISSALGFAFSYLLLASALWHLLNYSDALSGMWMGIMGLLLHAACGYNVRQTQSRSLLGDEKVSRFLQGAFTAVPPDLSLSTLIDDYAHKHYQKAFPVIEDGKLAGIVTVQALLALDRNKWHQLNAGSVMEKLSDENTISTDANAYQALELMQKYGRELLMVTDEGGHFAGVVIFRDLADFISAAMETVRDKTAAERSKT
ncbi:MAG: site-2 protease family protein [Alphaproteobacteria bacterium]|nr:site-2 protease family protein [Alphaproteobacteria bacterium]